MVDKTKSLGACVRCTNAGWESGTLVCNYILKKFLSESEKDTETCRGFNRQREIQ